MAEDARANGVAPPVEAPDTSKDTMLTSWKEIAAFFSRDVRTVQRWERAEALPVHRHRHARQSSVYAFPSELDAWWRQHAALDCAEPPFPEPLPGPGLRPHRVAIALTVVVLLLVAAAGWTWRRTRDDTPGGAFPMHRVAAIGGRLPILASSLMDVTGDGRDDAVVVTIGGGDVRIYFGRASLETVEKEDVRITSSAGAALVGGAVGDVDGDGLADLLLASIYAEPETYHGTGPTFLIRGRHDWPPALELPRDADTTFAVPFAFDIRMGACVGAPIDLNADGIADVILGAGDFSPPGRRSAGGLFVFFGRRQWPGRVDVAMEADVTIYGSRTGEALRQHCASGDFNGDRRADLAVLAEEATLWNLLGGRGRVYVIAGRDRWPRVVEVDDRPLVRLDGTIPDARLAPPVLADVNGDGRDDLLVGVVTGADEQGRGRVAIVFGSEGRPEPLPLDAADAVVTGGGRANAFGHAVASADLNRDGRYDVLVGDPIGGSIQVIFGRKSWPRSVPVARLAAGRLVAGEIGAGGDALPLGDYDGDGATDVAFTIGARAGRVESRRWAALVTPYLPMRVDVRPGDHPNVLLPTGVIAVAVSGSGPTRLSDIDTDSLRLAGRAATHAAWRDFDGDGVIDLRLYFDAAALPVHPAATRLALVGRTRQGIPIAGADDVSVVPAARTSR